VIIAVTPPSISNTRLWPLPFTVTGPSPAPSSIVTASCVLLRSSWPWVSLIVAVAVPSLISIKLGVAALSAAVTAQRSV